MEKITILIEDAKIELECAFVGGIMADETKAPMGAYCGTGDAAKIAYVVSHSLRAAIKLLREEMKLEPEELHILLHGCVEMAIQTELENLPEHNGTLKQHEMYLKLKKEGKL